MGHMYMAVLNYDILLTKNVMVMKKICLLLVGVLALFSCEQEELGDFIDNDLTQLQTRAASSIADLTR